MFNACCVTPPFKGILIEKLFVDPPPVALPALPVDDCVNTPDAVAET